MSLNRREKLRLGAAVQGDFAVHAAAFANPAVNPARRWPPLTRLRRCRRTVVPAPPHRAAINPQLCSKAKAALDSRPWIRHRDFIRRVSSTSRADRTRRVRTGRCTCPAVT